jgi:alpha-L-rhamnosidase
MACGNDGVILSYPADRAQLQGNWIWDNSSGPSQGGGTCFFRRVFSSAEVGKNPVLRISADGRYRAWLNGRLISRGPARGTAEFYHYETVELADLMVEGENVLAVEVRWYGLGAEPRAEAHLTPGLWAMLGSDETPGAVVTDGAWRVWRSSGHTLRSRPTNHPVSGWYCVVDFGEDVDLSKLPSNWTNKDFDDSKWSAPVILGPVIGRYQAKSWWFNRHEMVPRLIPPLEEIPFLSGKVRRIGTMKPTAIPCEARQIDGELYPSDLSWDDLNRAVSLEGSNTHYVIVDMDKLVTGYPRLTITAPAGTLVEYRYAEALSRNFKKGVRDDDAGTVEGYYDLFTCREGETLIEPFVWRTFRYLRIAVHHPAGPVTLNRLETLFTAYPFRPRATFESSDPLHRQLWDTSWWTARLCAHEHYEDCPYYEQLQYVLDTRLQALVSYLVAGDFRLARQALRQFAQARRNDGIIPSRAPAVMWEVSIIPPLALVWVEFLEDFYRFSGDLDFVGELWECLEGILKWFEQFDTDGLLDRVPYWVFTDWTLPEGKHICGSTGELNLRRIGALQAAVRMARALGKTERADYFARQVEKSVLAVKARLWNQAEGLFNDEPEGTLVAEHAGILAVLYDVVTGEQALNVLDRLSGRKDLARTSISYSYFTFRAYEKLGLYEKVYRDRLYNWTDQLKLHATTWFETGEPSRSDCHGWGSWIMCDLLTTVLGIKPARPGFAEVRIAPNLMNLDWARGSIPTAHGTISVAWERRGNEIHGQITLPEGVTGVLVAPSENTQPLTGGKQTVVIRTAI